MKNVMKRLSVKRMISFIIAFALVITNFAIMATTAEAAWDVKRGTVDYYVDLNGSQVMYLCNRKSIGTEIGTEYYMTYTVESINAPTLQQTGVIGTNVPNNQYPYVTVQNGKGGGIYYVNSSEQKKAVMLKEGYTYFLKFTITEEGYTYKVAWAEDVTGKSKYVEFDSVVGDVKTDLGHFGLFIAAGKDGMTGRLTKVRFYDKKGNDLGAQSTPSQKAEVALSKPLATGIKVAHSYDIILKDCVKIAISNKRLATGDKIYMEYTVKSSDSTIYQAGVITSNAPKAGYPYLTGYMLNNSYDPSALVKNGPLLEPGATYLIIFEDNEEVFDVTIQKTANGKTTFVNLQGKVGIYESGLGFRSIYLCGYSSKNAFMNAVLTNFKCYDSNGNNLGVQTNDTTASCEVIHYGEQEDYAGCEAMYYCDEDDSLYALYENKSLKYTGNNQTDDGTYRIEDKLMTVNISDTTKEYDYLYKYFTDDEENVYRRLGTCKLIFDTGDGSQIETQVLNADNGYMPMRPNEPTLEGNTFEGWYTLEGKEFDFEHIVTESTTVYAKWSNVDFQPVSDSGDNGLRTFGYIIGSSVILIGAMICGVVIITRGKKHEGKKETNT